MKQMSGNFGEKVRNYRILRGISQEQLALRADINVSFMGHIERGTKKPTIDTIDKILEALDIEYKEFFDAESEMVEFTMIDKIIYELKNRTPEEQELIYDIMKRIFAHKDFEKK